MVELGKLLWFQSFSSFGIKYRILAIKRGKDDASF